VVLVLVMAVVLQVCVRAADVVVGLGVRCLR